MVNIWAFEAFDRTLKDIMKVDREECSSKPFGGKVVVLGGDFRQVLPVIPKASRADVVLATINSSILWKHCKVLKLTENMRLQNGTNVVDVQETTEFSKLILDIGDGKLGGENDDEVEVEIPKDLLILDSFDHIAGIVSFTYPNIVDNMNDFNFFEDRAILVPKLEIAKNVNNYVLSLLPGEEK